MDNLDMARELERLLAKEQITEALLGYARGVDRMDLDLIRATFHPGARLDYGSMFTGDGEEFASFIGEVHPPMHAHTHHLSNISVRIDGDTAGSEAYVFVLTRTLDPTGLAHDMLVQARYVDRWERREGRWAVVDRRYLHSTDSIRASHTTLYPTQGSRDHDDPSFQVLDQ